MGLETALTIGGSILGGVVQSEFGSAGVGGSESQTTGQSSTTSNPVVIPRLPPVFPQLSTGGSTLTATPIIGSTATETITGGPRPTEEIEAELNTPWYTVAPPTPGVNVFGGEVGNPVQYLNSIHDPARYDRLQRELEQTSLAAPADALTGIDIDISLDPEIDQLREESVAGLTDLTTSVNSTIDDISSLLTEVGNIGIGDIPLPEIDTAVFDDLREQGDIGRANLDAVSADLAALDAELSSLLDEYAVDDNPFVEARTQDLVAQREAASRDAARRGISGPLSALATNPYDTAIADEKALAEQEVLAARTEILGAKADISAQQASLETVREALRLGDLAINEAEFAQKESVFEAEIQKGALELDQAELELGYQNLILSADQLLQGIYADLGEQADSLLQQELLSLGLALEEAELIIASQIPQITDTTTVSQDTTEQESTTQGDLFGPVADFTEALGGLFD